MLSIQTRAKLECIQKTVDALSQYLHENKELLSTLHQYHLPSHHHRYRCGSSLFRNDNGSFIQVVPDFSTETTLLDIESFLKDHPVFKKPVWENNFLEIIISQSYAKPFGQSYSLDDLIVFSVHVQIVAEKDSNPEEPYYIERNRKNEYHPVVTRSLFDISNGIQSEGIFIRTSYDLGDRKNIDSPTPAQVCD